jgi:hypothetical protein
MSSELEPWQQSPAEMVTEFESLTPEQRQAALEYARGLSLPAAEHYAAEQDESLPDFILLGYDGRVLVWSTDVADVQMVRRIEGFDRVPISDKPHAPIAYLPRWTIAVGAKLKSFQQHIGDNYGAALSTLALEWSRRQANEQES